MISELKKKKIVFIARTAQLAYDSTITLEEQILCIMKKLNETISQVNLNTETAEQYQTYLEEIKAQVETLQEEYIKFKEEINEEIDSKFLEITAQFQTYIDNQIALIRYYVDTQYQELNQKIDNIIAGDISVYDPTTGLLSPIQVVINNIFDMNRQDAITAGEFDSLELSATEFDEKEITAFNFDVYGKTLLTQ